MFEIAKVKNIYYEIDRTFVECTLSEATIDSTSEYTVRCRLYEPFGMRFKLPVNTNILLYIPAKEWLQEGSVIAFYTGIIDKIKITASNINILKTISTYFQYHLQLITNNITAHQTTAESLDVIIAVVQTLEGSNLDNTTKTALTGQRSTLTTKKNTLVATIGLLNADKILLQNTKTIFDTTFFE